MISEILLLDFPERDGYGVYYSRLFTSVEMS